VITQITHGKMYRHNFWSGWNTKKLVRTNEILITMLYYVVVD